MLPLFGKSDFASGPPDDESQGVTSRNQKITAENAGFAKGEMEPKSLSTVRHLGSPQVTNRIEAFPMRAHE
jgi:hypothetical protein